MGGAFVRSRGMTCLAASVRWRGRRGVEGLVAIARVKYRNYVEKRKWKEPRYKIELLMTVTLFRPVGLQELALVWDAGMRAFPPRLAHQPIFYPVSNLEYARQIARDWNAADEKSGFSGFVTKFELDRSYLSNFEPHIVGSSKHVEYWIPAENLSSFNGAIRGLIDVEEGFFGSAFTGHIPGEFLLNGKDARAQFVALSRSWEYSTFDVACEVSANRKAIFLNWLFWLQHDFSEFGVSQEQREVMLRRLQQCWEFNHIELLLPRSPNE